MKYSLPSICSVCACFLWMVSGAGSSLCGQSTQSEAIEFFHGSSADGNRVEKVLRQRNIGYSLTSGGISSLICVQVANWDEARIAVETIGIVVSAGDPLPAFRSFCLGGFELAIEQCTYDLLAIESACSAPLHFELIDQSRRQLAIRRSSRLPSSREWSDLKKMLPRDSQIQRLIPLMPLSAAMIIDGRVTPVATLVPSDDERLAVTEEKEIDPLVELVAMNLTPAECELLAPGMTYDWLLVPKNAEVAPFGVSVIRPCTRHFLCQLICNACGRAELIHLNSLSRDEWRDEAKVRSLLATVVQMPK